VREVDARTPSIGGGIFTAADAGRREAFIGAVCDARGTRRMLRLPRLKLRQRPHPLQLM